MNDREPHTTPVAAVPGLPVAPPAAEGGTDALRAARKRFRSRFWDDLDEDLKDPEFRQAYIETSEEIAALDQPEEVPGA
jgi:hypothetical protein